VENIKLGRLKLLFSFFLKKKVALLKKVSEKFFEASIDAETSSTQL
jgi:hypothetical protein